MLVLAYYLLKVTLVSAILYAYYLLGLRNKKFHQYNRFYLLFTVILSLVIPLLKVSFSNYQHTPLNLVHLFAAINYPDVYVKTSTLKHSFISDFNEIALCAFLSATALMSFILISKVLKIFFTIRNNPKKMRDNVCLVFTKSKGTPFSFFKYIFLDENINLDSKEGNNILLHELTHVKQHHTVDKLFLNVVLLVAWANPIFWLMSKELNMLHEFLADQKAISEGDTTAFATMLLTATFPQRSYVLTNSFFHSPIKRRLFMISTSKTVKYSYFRRIMVLPLLASICILSAFKIEKKNSGELQSQQDLLTKYRNANKKEDAETGSNSVNASDTIEAKFPGGNEAWKKYLETNLNANVPVEKDKARKGLYTVKVQFIVLETGEIKDISATQIPDHCPSCAIEAVRIIKSGPKWDPMTIDGKSVASKQIQFISFLVEK